MKRCILFLIVVLSSQVMANEKCNFDLTKTLCGKVEFVSGISRKKDSSFKLYIYLKDKMTKGIFLKVNPDIKLWMVMKGGHGHGSEPVQLSKVKDYYLVKNVWFLMQGQWDLKISYKHGQKMIEKILHVCVGRTSELSQFGSCIN